MHGPNVAVAVSLSSGPCVMIRMITCGYQSARPSPNPSAPGVPSACAGDAKPSCTVASCCLGPARPMAICSIPTVHAMPAVDSLTPSKPPWWSTYLPGTPKRRDLRSSSAPFGS